MNINHGSFLLSFWLLSEQEPNSGVKRAAVFPINVSKIFSCRFDWNMWLLINLVQENIRAGQKSAGRKRIRAIKQRRPRKHRDKANPVDNAGFLGFFCGQSRAEQLWHVSGGVQNSPAISDVGQRMWEGMRSWCWKRNSNARRPHSTAHQPTLLAFYPFLSFPFVVYHIYDGEDDGGAADVQKAECDWAVRVNGHKDLKASAREP